MPQIRETDIHAVMQQSKDPKVSSMASLPATVAAVTRVLNVTLELAAEAPQSKADVAAFAVNKTLAVMDVAALNKPPNKTVKAAGLVVQVGMATAGMAKIAGAARSPSQVLLVATFATAQKVVLAAGHGEVDRCRIAVMSLAANGGMSAFVCLTAGAGTVGVACLVGALGVAADAFSVYDACYVAEGAGAH
jgi:hypothetical protein